MTLEINGGDFFEEIVFSNSKLALIRITGGIFHSKIYFERGVYDRVEIIGGEFKKGISFGEFIPPNRSVKYTGGFSTEHFPPWTSNYNGIYKTIKFEGDILSKVNTISNCFIHNDLLLNSTTTDFELNGLLVKGDVVILEGNVSIKSSQIETLKLEGMKTTSKIVFDISNSICNSVLFEGYCSKDSSLSFKHQKSTLCRFENFINFGSISFNTLELHNLKLNLEMTSTELEAQALNLSDYCLSIMYSQTTGYQNEIIKSYEVATRPVLEIKLIESPSSMHFINSDIGKASFFASKVHESALHFKDSKLTDVFLAGTKFPSSKIEDEDFDPEQYRFALSQIKKIYENRGDHLTASEYGFKELEVHRNELKRGKSRRNVGERISLLLSYWSSRHGQIWTRSLSNLIIWGTFSWLLISFIIFDVDIEKFSIDNVLIAFSSIEYFLQYLLPIHKIGLLNEYAKEIGGIDNNSPNSKLILPAINIIDFFWRLLSGFLVYQLITAFRKYGKK